jgi:hypothetical protein
MRGNQHSITRTNESDAASTTLRIVKEEGRDVKVKRWVVGVALAQFQVARVCSGSRKKITSREKKETRENEAKYLLCQCD